MANRTDPYKVVIEATVGGNKGKGDIAIDDVVFDKNCIYYDGPYGPTTTTTQKTTTKTTTTTTQKTTKTTTKSTSSGTTTTPIFTPSPPDGDGSSTVVIVVIVICSLLAISVIAFAVFTLMKRRRQL